jgi:hypothetical protein
MTDLDAFRLAGFTLAHALVSIQGGATLATLAFAEHNGERDLVRYVDAEIAATIVAAHEDLAERLANGGYAALAYDGYSTIDGVRSDALMVEIIVPGDLLVGTVIQPYEPGRKSRIPTIGRGGHALPIGSPRIERSLDVPGAVDAIIEGARTHPHGNVVLSSEPD